MDTVRNRNGTAQDNLTRVWKERVISSFSAVNKGVAELKSLVNEFGSAKLLAIELRKASDALENELGFETSHPSDDGFQHLINVLFFLNALLKDIAIARSEPPDPEIATRVALAIGNSEALAFFLELCARQFSEFEEPMTDFLDSLIKNAAGRTNTEDLVKAIEKFR